MYDEEFGTQADDQTIKWESFLEIENELYRVEPLVIWQYKGSSLRDKIITNKEYYQRIKPYETNPYFDNMKGHQ